jgi:hypothetical protein
MLNILSSYILPVAARNAAQAGDRRVESQAEWALRTEVKDGSRENKDDQEVRVQNEQGRRRSNAP